MEITYLGHAGFVVEAASTRVLVDPWFFPAFLGSWFPAPDNRFLADEVLAQRYDLVFVSHVHEDHFDRTFLDGLPRDVPVLCARFRSKGLLEAWRALGFRDVHAVDHGESVDVAPGLRATVLCDTSHREDSALMLDAGGVRFLDLNDCLVQFGELPEGVDLLTRQYSGAMWYPNCYAYPPAVMAEKVRAVRRNLFRTLVTTCELARPRWYVPSAGPPCFLDPALARHNRRAETIFPVWSDVAADFAAALPEVGVVTVAPGDRIVVGAGDPEVVRGDRTGAGAGGDLAAYAAARRAEYESVPGAFTAPVTDEELLAHLLGRQRKCAALLDGYEQRVEIATERRAWTFTLRAAPELELDAHAPGVRDPNVAYRLSMPEWVLRAVVDDDCWEEALLSMRVGLERDPDRYDVQLLAFLRYGHQRAVVQRVVQDIKSSDETIDRDGYRLQRYCPHSGEDLTHATICDGVVECPRHHWKWDAATGRCVEGGTLPLRIEPLDRTEATKAPVP